MLKTFSLIAGVALLLTGSPAVAGTASVSAKAAEQMQDMSAAKKKKKTTVHVYREPGPDPSGYRWLGMDPVFPQNPEITFRRSIGQCIIDLGYGRWETCDGPSLR